MHSKSLTIDEVYDIIGHFGFSQAIYFISVGLLHYFTCHHMLLNIFVGLELDFSCISKDEGHSLFYGECPNNSAEKCTLTYNTTFYSIAKEWNLVCDQKYKLPLVQSIWMGGVMAGAFFLGGIADKLGRLPTVMIAILGTVVFEGSSAFAPNYETYLTLRFFGGVCCSLVILVSYVLVQEFAGTSRRSFGCLLISIFSSLGIGAMSLSAALVQNWRGLVFVSSFSGIGFFVLLCFMPESPRWLLGQGRLKKSKEVLVHVAQLNRTQHLLPKNWELLSPVPEVGKGKTTGSLKDLFKHPYVLKLTLIQVYSWFVTSASYYALTMAATSLPGNIYVSTTLSGFVEIPAAIVGQFAVEKLGRRISICSSMIMSGGACLVIPIMSLIWPSSISTFALLGKLCISANFTFIYIHSGEIFPTVVRNTGLGVVSVAARVGGVASPFILTLRDIRPNLEYLTLGVMTLVSGFLNLQLPETLGRPMPETINDIINMKGISGQSTTNNYTKLLNKDEEEDRFAEDSDTENDSQVEFSK